jgi:hypothetical protein
MPEADLAKEGIFTWLLGERRTDWLLDAWLSCRSSAAIRCQSPSPAPSSSSSMFGCLS